MADKKSTSDNKANARFDAAQQQLGRIPGATVGRAVDPNPSAAVLRREAQEAPDRVLTDLEIVRYWQAASMMEEPFGALLKILLLTGARLNEVARMSRLELSDDAATWSLPSARTKNRRAHLVPLPPLAQDIIANVKQIDGCPFLFSTNGRTPVSGWSKIKKRMDGAMGAPPSWRLHDLRRTCAIGMAAIGVAPHIVEVCLNIRGSYARGAGAYNKALHITERRAALGRWAAHITRLTEECACSPCNKR